MASDDIQEALRLGDLGRARALGIERVRAMPGDAGARAMLFQLCAVEGDWKRADAQLDMIGTIDASALDFVQDYKAAVAAEAARAEVMAGRAAPQVFGDPAPWIARLTEALRLNAEGEQAAAAATRREALEEAPALPGLVNETEFEWIADADQRFGPVLECVLNGEYHWVPLQAIAKLEFEPPRDLRDLVWAVGIATFVNGGTWPVMVPARYPGSEAAARDDPTRALARRTEWHEIAEGQYAGRGQRMLATESEDVPLLELRTLTMADAPPVEG